MLKIGIRVAALVVMLVAGFAWTTLTFAHRPRSPETPEGAFEQLDIHGLRSPNSMRTASGAPGPEYWQQRVDYVIDVTLDEDLRRIIGSETITYRNNSPDSLPYLWVQLDQNRFRTDSEDMRSMTVPSLDAVTYDELDMLLERDRFRGGAEILAITGGDGEPLAHTVVGTMMRVDLSAPLAPHSSLTFHIEWWHNIVDGTRMPARCGYEYFEDDGNYIFEIAQWYPRLAAYTDYSGWQHDAFLGRGEFTLEFGEFQVNITVPADHVVASTGVLLNSDEVLTAQQMTRLEMARSAKKPVYIVTPEEALANSVDKASGTRTWRFKASDVRDFAFASSRRFIWDALGDETPGGKPLLAMSFYPKEAQPLWNQFSTESILHAIDVYSRHVFDYPYPVSSSVNGSQGAMEYPMITFNGPRPYPDGTYWEQEADWEDPRSEHAKLVLLSIIFHETGHTWFPMVVNSDERQWTWLDEGLNSFVQFLAEEEWQEDFGGPWGYPSSVVEYMQSDDQTPIVTHSDSVRQFLDNAYTKPATALNILRETVLGREIFDFAFKEYARRWMFKRPTPADFFRSMEDASGVDLDWFWNGWFYGTGHVDIGIDRVTQYRLDTLDPKIEKDRARQDQAQQPKTLTEIRNKNMPRRVDERPGLQDFYDTYDEYAVTPFDEAEYAEILDKLTDSEKQLLKTEKIFYLVEFENLGGVVMPLPIRVTYADGSTEDIYLAPEIWRYDLERASRLFITDREIVSWELDPHLEIADTDPANNHYPREPEAKTFQLVKPELEVPPNPMQKASEGAENGP
jgi:hypothetical protein